ncbi:TPA: AMP-binding protein, partial [Burkholderia contaminans]
LARSGVRKVIVGGEELTPQHIATLRKIDPAIEIYNEYGPTEATVGCIVERVEDAPPTVLIGRPIADTRVYMLDDALRPVPLGVPGEICLAGAGLARGYHQRPDVTAAKFVEHPFPGEARIYRTGDIGRWLPDGRIQCYGRVDHQVKIRGHRVELGEIEAAIAAHEDVVGAAVMLRESAHGVRKLAAYVKGAASLSVPDLRAYLAGKLPDYMVPSDIIPIAEFP